MPSTPSAPRPSTRSQSRRAALGSLVGTTLEWYDFFIYGTMSALVFGDVFFPNQRGVLGTLAAFATFAVGFAARPIGSILFGHFGDRLGRRTVLIITLLMMGTATILIGCIPPYASIGVWAPVLLVVCRLVQGAAVGGEWGGAALLSVENAPAHRRGLFGSSTQAGSPAGLLLASVVVSASVAVSGDAFNQWGWRIPFLVSIVIVGVGLAIRRGLAESTEFTDAVESGAGQHRAPVVQVLRAEWRPVLIGAGMAAANNVLYYTVTTYTLAYVTGSLGVPKGSTVNDLSIVSICFLVSIPLFGWLSDKVGASRQVAVAGIACALFIFPYYLMIQTGRSWLVLIAMIVGMAIVQAAAYAPQPAIFAELFPAKMRYTGAGLANALPSTVVGGTAPFVATWLYSSTHSNAAMAAYTVAVSLLSAGCGLLAHRRLAGARRTVVRSAVGSTEAQNA